MKKALTSLFSVLMAVTVLASGMALTVTKMTCLHSGKVKTAFYSLDDCCAKTRNEKKEAGLKAGCCKYSSESFFLEHNAPAKTFAIKKMDIAGTPVILPQPVVLPVLYSQATVHSFADLPPPLSVRERLAMISILLI